MHANDKFQFTNELNSFCQRLGTGNYRQESWQVLDSVEMDFSDTVDFSTLVDQATKVFKKHMCWESNLLRGNFSLPLQDL